MSFEAWEGFWKIVLLGTTVAFSLMSVVVMIGSFRDVRDLYRDLRKEEEEEKTPTPPA